MRPNDTVSSLTLTSGPAEVPAPTFPTAIAGHGSNVLASFAADPLEINGILLRASEQRCLILSFDLLYVGGQLERDLRAELRARFALADEEVFLFASHTHFAPPTDATLPELGPYNEAYSLAILQTALMLVAELMRSTPSRCAIETRRGQLFHSVNRRSPRLLPTYTRKNGISFARVSFAPYLGGQRDETATIITFASVMEKADPIALLWNYACHPVGHTPGSVTSADFPGAVRHSLREHYKRPLPVLFLQGFCADTRPYIVGQSGGTIVQRLLGRARSALTGSPPMQPTEAAWLAWVGTLQQGVVQIAESAALSTDEATTLATACAFAPGPRFFEGTTRTAGLTVRGLRIGDTVEILGLGAEVSTGWQRHLTAAIGQTRATRIFAGYCGDVFSYLPTPEQLHEGGYEVSGFQRLLGMRGQFRAHELHHTVTAAVGVVAHAIRGNS